MKTGNAFKSLDYFNEIILSNRNCHGAIRKTIRNSGGGK